MSQTSRTHYQFSCSLRSLCERRPSKPDHLVSLLLNSILARQTTLELRPQASDASHSPSPYSDALQNRAVPKDDSDQSPPHSMQTRFQTARALPQSNMDTLSRAHRNPMPAARIAAAQASYESRLKSAGCGYAQTLFRPVPILVKRSGPCGLAPIHLSPRGSKASRNPSPKKFSASSVLTSTVQGKTSSHQ